MSPKGERSPRRVGIASHFRSIVIYWCLLVLAFPPSSLHSEKIRRGIAGIAWRVRGIWRINGNDARISAGDVIEPGSRLQPVSTSGEGDHNHSITIFLADGRIVEYECFTAKDCARGFRVPFLYHAPQPVALDMLAHIHAAHARGINSSSMERADRLPRDEVVAVLGLDNRVSVGGLAADLSSGRYTYDLRPLNIPYPTQFHVAIEKTAGAITITLPGPGFYDVAIADDLNIQRIDLFVAAMKPAQAATLTKSFHQVQALLKQWNSEGFGWPIHDFQRAYLESLMAGGQPRSIEDGTRATGNLVADAGAIGGEFVSDKAVDEMDRAGVAAEPAFSPKPGVFNGNTAVTLRCDTPGAAIHYTVDSSEPMANSPVYTAPIMVNGTGLTIKSFASAAGRKDSAVVTGIFRIRQ